MREKFRLFSNCIIVKGVRRSTICDLQRNEVHFIPNRLRDIIGSSSIYKDTELSEETKTCIQYLIDNELGHFAFDHENFPDLDLEYSFPGEISHAIIEISEQSDFPCSNAFLLASKLGAKFIELRIKYDITYGSLTTILNAIKPTKISNVSILMRNSNCWSTSKVTELLITFQRISSMTLYARPEDGIENIDGRIVSYSKTEFENKMCGKIHTQCFSCNIRTFTESQSFNTCLNGKLSITEDGLVKNCLSMHDSFGHINGVGIEAIIKGDSFRKLWRISKDKITVCKDCEFRHVCTDCRAFLEDPSDLYSKPLKCGYDPYTGDWKDWSTNPLKELSIKYYGLK